MNFTSLGKNLRTMSDEQLLAGPRALSYSEKHSSCLVILHLVEVKRRRLALSLGYKSIFAYCEEVLQMDPGTIATRMQIASRCLEFPQLLESIMSGRISQTAAAKVSAHLTPENAADLLVRVGGKTSREVDQVIKELTGESAASAEILKLQVSPSFKAKLDRLIEVLGIKTGKDGIEQALEKAIDDSLRKRDPKQRLERREQRQKRQKNRANEDKPSLRLIRRAVPLKTYDQVFQRAHYRCEFQSKLGKRCPQTIGLQIDHVKPWAMGGSHSMSNLRVLCQAHNLHKNELDFGT